MRPVGPLAEWISMFPPIPCRDRKALFAAP